MSELGKIEATLFVGGFWAGSLYDVASAIQGTFLEKNIQLTPKFRTDDDLACSLGGLSLTVTRADTALDLRPFLTATTPGTPFGLAPAVQRKLVSHRQALVVRVSGPVQAATQETRLALCYLATKTLIELSDPDLIYWAKSNSVYTVASFFERTGDADTLHSGMTKRNATAVDQAINTLREDIQNQPSRQTRTSRGTKVTARNGLSARVTNLGAALGVVSLVSLSAIISVV